MQYRRVLIPGGAYFFTVVTRHRCPIFASDAAVAALRQAFHAVQLKHPFTIEAAVVLPDHLHCIWTLPPHDANFALRWRLIKTHFTQHYSRKSVWQNRYWEHALRDEIDLTKHLAYIHFNPVKHGLVKQACDWPYSSFKRFVAKGVYPSNWGLSDNEIDGVGTE